jgi:hypothetical protein
MVMCSCHHRHEGSINKWNVVQPSLGVKVRPYSKIIKAKRTGAVATEV